MESDWALVEYRRGRYVKVASEGTVLGRATDDEVMAWFAAHGWKFDRPAGPELSPEPDPGEQQAAGPGQPGPGIGQTAAEASVPESGLPSAKQPVLPAFEKDTAEQALPDVRAVDARAPGTEEKADDSIPDHLPPQAPPKPETPQPDQAAREPSGSDAPPPASLEPVVASAAKTASGPASDVLPPAVAPESGIQRPASAPSAFDVSPTREATGRAPSRGQPGSTARVRFEAAPETKESVSELDSTVPPPSAPAESSLPAGLALSEPDATDRWLWVDPRQERGYSPAAFDVAAFLDRAFDLFRAKPWAAGQEPRRLAVHPSGIARALERAAEDRGLELIADPKVTAGTYMLALAEREVEN